MRTQILDSQQVTECLSLSPRAVTPPSSYIKLARTCGSISRLFSSLVPLVTQLIPQWCQLSLVSALTQSFRISSSMYLRKLFWDLGGMAIGL